MTRREIAKEALMKRVKAREEKVDKIHMDNARDINHYLSKHGPISESALQFTYIENYCNTLCLAGAWAYDRMQGKIATTHNKDYRGSRTKKIRKALGYNL